MEVGREALSRHNTISIYKGRQERSQGFLRIYPQPPARVFYSFDTESYTDYRKLGEYGDEQQDQMQFLKEEQTLAILNFLDTLSVGDKVNLHWSHDYVTKREGPTGTTTMSPERVITLLEKIYE